MHKHPVGAHQLPILYTRSIEIAIPNRCNEYELTVATLVDSVRRMTQYIAYLRVSTQRQGISGLGLEAQRGAVTSVARGDVVLAEYIEIESGKRDDRPQLRRALEHAKKCKATLLIAKIDRLARKMSFIASLMDGDVEFVACDMPQANRLMLHIMAAFAEHEAKMISDRTKVALAAAKARGIVLGGDRPAARARRTAAAIKRNAPAKAKALELRAEGMTLAEIGIRLGGKHPTQVRRLLA